ncbi:MAG: LPS assembly lipoprotein LptE [Pirellulaceae bacterium]|nr:LPS assembly lipoprotein LptE [Pirellulaceae bacterium]
MTGCSQYRFGNCTLYTPNVSSVHVQMFENDTFRRGLGPWLTEAVVKEVQLRTPYRIADARSADSFLRAQWVADRKTILVENANDEGRDLGYTGQVEVTWTDRYGNPLTAGRVIKITEDVSFVPEVGQSVTTAQQELVRKLAQQIVNQMEAGW